MRGFWFAQAADIVRSHQEFQGVQQGKKLPPEVARRDKIVDHRSLRQIREFRPMIMPSSPQSQRGCASGNQQQI
jgi:hypothetical protein